MSHLEALSRVSFDLGVFAKVARQRLRRTFVYLFLLVVLSTAATTVVWMMHLREAVRWPLVDDHGKYDFRSVSPFLEASEKYGIDVIWDLFHYGYPRELDIFSDEFTKRFADYCYAAAKYLSRYHHGACYITPVNEPSFFSWAAGEVGRFAPHSARSRENCAAHDPYHLWRMAEAVWRKP